MCWVVHCRFLWLCWVGTCQVLFLCQVGNTCGVVHTLGLVNCCRVMIPCWLVTFRVPYLCLVRRACHTCWVGQSCQVCQARHTCRLVHPCWSGRRRDHCDDSPHKCLWNDWGKLDLMSGHVARPRLLTWQGPMIPKRLRVMTLMTSGRIRRLDLRCRSRSMAWPQSIRRVSVSGSGAGPSWWRCGPGPLHNPASSRQMTGPWWVVTSLRPVTSSVPITTVWSMVFRSLGPRRHLAAVGPGSSHHRNARWQGLLLVTGPGRPVGRVCLHSPGR